MEIAQNSSVSGVETPQSTRSEIQYLFKNILAQAPVGLAVMTLEEGRLIEANQTFFDQIEYEREVALGRTTREMGIWPDLSAREKRVSHLRTFGNERGKEIIIRCRSGRLKNILISSQSLMVDGQRCVLGVGVDITSRKNAETQLELAKEQAETASRAKSEFLTTVSHEIRTPLTAILSLSELLIEKARKTPAIPDEFRETLERIQKNTSFVIELVNAILDLSKIEAKKLEVQKAPLDAAKLITESLESLKCLAETKQLSFNIDVSALGSSLVFTDPLRLQQILSNVVGNALKFTHEGFISVHAHLIGPPEHTSLEILVQDSGRGIPDEKQSLLFKSFTQIDSLSDRRHPGTGLGLHLSKRLALLLGGDVQLVESAENEGSTFTIVVDATLPAPQAVPRLSAETVSAKGDSTEQKKSSARILLIEDNLDIQFAVKEILTFEGHEVDVASDGRASISFILNQPYDVVLMDMHMPDLNGIEATKALRKIGYQGRIVAFSAAIQKEDRDRAIQAGCDGFLKKPFEVSELLDLVSTKDSRTPGNSAHG